MLYGSPPAMFSRTIPGIYDYNYPLPPTGSSRDNTSFPVNYPESSQRTRIHDTQFHQMPPEVSSQQTYLQRSRDTIPAASAFSQPPIPSDRPPPSLRLPSPPSSLNDILPPISASSSHSGGGNYRALSLSLSDSEDDDAGYNPRNRHNLSLPNFIPIVPNTTEISNGVAAGPDLDFSYHQSSALSSPESASELRLSPPIETIPSQVERREARRRKGPEKMHRCEICKKEFPRPSAVQTHMNVHSNARPYTCGFPNCPKTFSVRSNARRHYRTHGDKLLRLGSPVPTQPGIKFVELIHVPEPPLPPLSLSQAPFRVRWVPANERALTKTVHPTKRPERKLNLLEKPDGSHEQQMRPPMFLYDPSSNPGPSTHGVRDSSGPWRTYP